MMKKNFVNPEDIQLILKAKDGKKQTEKDLYYYFQSNQSPKKNPSHLISISLKVDFNPWKIPNPIDLLFSYKEKKEKKIDFFYHNPQKWGSGFFFKFFIYPTFYQFLYPWGLYGIHASAAKLPNGKLIVIIGNSKTGKSTLIHFLEKHGLTPYITDQALFSECIPNQIFPSFTERKKNKREALKIACFLFPLILAQKKTISIPLSPSTTFIQINRNLLFTNHKKIQHWNLFEKLSQNIPGFSFSMGIDKIILHQTLKKLLQNFL